MKKNDMRKMVREFIESTSQQPEEMGTLDSRSILQAKLQEIAEDLYEIDRHLEDNDTDISSGAAENISVVANLMRMIRDHIVSGDFGEDPNDPNI